MKTRTLVMLVVLLLFGIAVLSPVTNTLAQGEGLTGRTITGTVYFISGRRPGLSQPFTLIINRITTADEVSQLNSALQAGKQDELLRTLSRTEADQKQNKTKNRKPTNAIMVNDQGDGRIK